MVKVGDFGLAVQLEHSFSNRVGFCGTSLYAGPELYRNTAVLKSDVWSLGISVIEMAVLKSDVWSLGISVIEMAEGRHPFAGHQHHRDGGGQAPVCWADDGERGESRVERRSAVVFIVGVVE